MMQPLRDYQSEDVERIFEEWKEHKSTLYVAATGLGKTRVMVEVAHRLLPARTLFLCHRSELITQARSAFARMEMECEIEKAEQIASTNLFNRTPVVLATVQTLISGEVDNKRMQRFNPKEFGLLLYDESHHSVSPGNKSIVDYFTRNNPDIKVLGVTATPNRHDEEALGQIFETVASDRDILFGRDNGWLVDVEQMFAPIAGLDYSHVRTTAGDLNGRDLAMVMEHESCIQGVVQPTLEALFRLPQRALDNVPVPEWGAMLSERADRRRAIVFAASVVQAEMLSNVFNRVVPFLSTWVCGKTREQERQEVFKAFAEGKASILVNVGVTTEGYDNPLVDLIVMGRPTKSTALYTQMIGRGTRPIPGLVDSLPTADERVIAIAASAKPHVTVLDFVGNSGRHKLITAMDILGGKYSEEAVIRSTQKAKGLNRPVIITKEMEEQEAKIRKEIEQARLKLESNKRQLVARSNYTTTSINPFNAMDIAPVRERGWDKGKMLSSAQRRVLQKQGLDPDNMQYAEGRAVLNELFRRWKGNLCSMKQAATLKKYQWVLGQNNLDTKNLSRQEASRLLDQIATKQGWRKKYEKTKTVHEGV